MQPGPDPATVVQRVLLLERQQGFQNRAAIGGLEAFVRTQRDRAAGNPRVAQVDKALQGYAGLQRHDRELAVARALRALFRAGAEESRRSPMAPSPASAASSRAGTKAQSARATAKPQLHVVHGPDDLDLPVISVKGVGKATAEALAKQGVRTVRDLLYYFPRTHYDYQEQRSISRLRLGERTTLVGTVRDVRNNRTKRGIVITTVTLEDQSGTIAVRWFNQPYLQQKFPLGARVAISGEPDVFNGRYTFQPRDWELIDERELTHTGRLVPVYSLTKGLYQRSLRTLIRRVLEEYGREVEEYLPEDLRDDLRLPALAEALGAYHFPADSDARAWAEQRLAFDELFLIQLGLQQRKRERERPEPAVAVEIDRGLLESFVASLPFELTRAQERAIDEVIADLARSIPMNRLLEGDVGSGKTVVAAAALHQIAAAGRQGVVMAPTEILAEQHHRTLQAVVEPFGLRCELLIGSTPRSRRKEVLAGLADGSVPLAVGTHALIQEGVDFAALGLAITDEQHRFGVEQRALLRQKGLTPHVLAMTATPIPRTLAMTIYGDLDVSVIDELPPGRKRVITTWSRTPAEAYGVVRDEIRQGRQAFVICPVIEESADSDMRSVIAEHRELQRLTFADYRVGLLHGQMKPAEKDATLLAFRAGEYDILVATSVVEVGIDIPNATAMVIRDAHRFGLAQLHQFRGRVGRGAEQAYCVLLSGVEGDDARERLEALTAIDDGFKLAEEDLRLRGPGEFWGTRQSGLPELRIAQLGDIATVELAQRAANVILAADPHLEAPAHRALADQVRRYWAAAADLS